MSSKGRYTLPVFTGRDHGCPTRVSFWTPVFTARRHSPWTRVATCTEHNGDSDWSTLLQANRKSSDGSATRLFVPATWRQPTSAAAEVVMLSSAAGSGSGVPSEETRVRRRRTGGGFVIARGKRTRSSSPSTLRYLMTRLSGRPDGNRKSSSRTGFVISRGRKRQPANTDGTTSAD